MRSDGPEILKKSMLSAWGDMQYKCRFWSWRDASLIKQLMAILEDLSSVHNFRGSEVLFQLPQWLHSLVHAPCPMHHIHAGIQIINMKFSYKIQSLRKLEFLWRLNSVSRNIDHVSFSLLYRRALRSIFK